MDYILDLTAQQINQNLKKVPELEQDINELSSDLNNNYALKTETPTKVSQLTNDKGYLTSVPSEYVTETELNAKGFLTEHQDLSAYAKTSEVNTNISAHNTNKTSHNDIRLLIQELTTRLNTVANSDDVDLDQLSEIVAYIKNNKDLIDGITTSKVNVSDIINNLTTSAANKPLSAAQGVALKALIDAIEIPTKLSELTDDSTHRLVTDTEKSNWNAKSNFSGKFSDLSNKPTTLSGYGITDGATKTEVDSKQPKGDYALKSELPTKVSDLTNDKGYLTSAPVTKVNNKTGAVTLTAEDVGAVAESELDSAIEDALAAAKESGKFDGASGKDGISTTHSWNGTTLTVTSASGTSSANLKGDKGDTYTLTSADKSQIAASAADLIPINDYAKKTEVNSSISSHNTATTSHNDIRLLIEGLTTRLNALANSDDTTLDQMSEVVAYIKNNKNLIDGITTNKVNVSDIIDNLTSSISNKPLSAKQGVELKKLIDAIDVPTSLSELSADSTHRLVTDTEKSTWNNKSNFSGKFTDLSNKPATLSGYGITDAATKTELNNLSTEVSGKQPKGDYVLSSNIPTKTSQLTNDSGFLTEISDAYKAEITQMVIESLGGNPIFGYVDKNNNIVVQGNLADGTYYVKYETDDETINIGNLVIDNNVYYSVTSTLTNCKSNNSTREVVAGSAYSATITANSGYKLKTVTVTMGGQNVSVTNGVINIASVTGNIVITAVAEVAIAYINQIPLSIGADGKPFNNGQGYKTGYRLSLSGGGESAQEGTEVTGFIPVTKDSVIRAKNIAYSDDVTRGVVGYDANFAKLSTGGGVGIGAFFGDNGYDDGNGVRRSWKLGMYSHFASDSLKYIRLCSTDINANSIITVDQEIK